MKKIILMVLFALLAAIVALAQTPDASARAEIDALLTAGQRADAAAYLGSMAPGAGLSPDPLYSIIRVP